MLLQLDTEIHKDALVWTDKHALNWPRGRHGRLRKIIDAESTRNYAPQIFLAHV